MTKMEAGSTSNGKNPEQLFLNNEWTTLDVCQMTKMEAGSTSNGKNPKQLFLNNERNNKNGGLPLAIAVNCLEDCSFEQQTLAGVAIFQHIGLAQIADGRIESAMAVLLHSLAYLPRAVQRRLQPWQLILCLGSTDKGVDSALASDLGLRLRHVDTTRAEEVADTVMALLLGLIRHTHLLATGGFSSSDWLGSVQPLCRGMRRCRGLVLGIIGRSASACALATRSLAFKMRVLYYDEQEAKGKSLRGRRSFPLAAEKMDSLKELMSASDLISLHCAVTNETFQIINAESLQYLKPGVFIVNTGSSHLLDDCALKQALMDGTVMGCALDGVDGPQWLEAWVREMPNVLILPQSADYSEEVWMEIREKAVSILQFYFLDGVVPPSAVSDEDNDQKEAVLQEDILEKQDKEIPIPAYDIEQSADGSKVRPEVWQNWPPYQSQETQLESQDSVISQQFGGQHEHRHGRAGKKSKRRPGRRRSQQKSDTIAIPEQETNVVALQRDDHCTSISGRDQVFSLNLRFASPEDSNHRHGGDVALMEDTASEKQAIVSKRFSIQPGDMLKDGFVIALQSKDRSGYHVARKRGPGCGWFLDTIGNVTKRDPAAQFLVVFQNRERIGLRSFAAGGKLLQVTKRMELAFVSHNFDVWEGWVLEGSTLEECRLTNSRIRSIVLDVSIEILAAVGEEDGVARWLS